MATSKKFRPNNGEGIRDRENRPPDASVKATRRLPVSLLVHRKRQIILGEFRSMILHCCQFAPASKGVSSPLLCSSYLVEQADMASRTQIVTTHKPQAAGLAHFMARVLKEHARAAKKLDADAVHDLRVALRRCRTMADALATFDPDKSFRAMRKASRRTFRSLGQLRDIQVMREWMKKLAPAGDPLAARLAGIAGAIRRRRKSGSRSGPRRIRHAQVAPLVARTRRALATSAAGQPGFPASRS